MPVSFESKGLNGPAADGQSTNASTRPAKKRRRVSGHHRGFRSPRGWPEESRAGRSAFVQHEAGDLVAEHQPGVVIEAKVLRAASAAVPPAAARRVSARERQGVFSMVRRSEISLR